MGRERSMRWKGQKMKHDIREFFTAFSTLRISRASKVAIWATVGSMLFIATAQQASLSAAISEMALVANISAQVEMARSIEGAKKVTKTIMSSEFSWGDDEYSCLNRLWTKESHWNYKAHNYRSGAHGIPQALPAVKMEVISSDWRTNPVTQIRWGLRYIDIRYETPCQAWSKFKRSRYY